MYDRHHIVPLRSELHLLKSNQIQEIIWNIHIYNRWNNWTCWLMHYCTMEIFVTSISSAASDPGIFRMGAVLFPPGALGAVLQVPLSASTFYFVQQYRTWTWSIFSFPHSIASLITKTLADYRCVHVIPAVITHCAPYALMENFDTTWPLILAIYEPHCCW